MNLQDSLIAMLVILIVVFAVFQRQELNQLSAELVYEKHRLAKAHTDEVTALVASKKVETRFLGKALSLSGARLVSDVNASEAKPFQLVLVIDERGCDLCNADEIAFLNSLAEDPRFAVKLIYGATTQRQLKTFLNRNPIHFDVYQATDSFFEVHEITANPILFLTDQAGSILATHHPRPATSFWTKLFHDAILEIDHP